ncbi:MAG: ABC transporter permease [Acidimicrobiia bacterium]|nr:ABC transporter permease [Acidimicrobiia bacterium]
MTTETGAELRPSKLHLADIARTASVGLKTRKLRAALSALGIMIGIASMVAVLGLSESSKSDLLAQLDRLGTNLLTVQAGQGFGRGSGELPDAAPEMIARIAPVETTSAVSSVDGANAYRTDYIPSGQTGGITVQAVDLNLLDTLSGSVAAGRFHDEASGAYPTVVLGSVAAERMGITDLDPAVQIWLGDQWFAVIGILAEFELSADLDRAAMVGMEAAATFLGDDNVPTSIYVRTDPRYVEDVMGVLGATANPEAPEEVEVDRPSDALEAREAADDAFTALFLGLGAVALLVGGVGIANVMVISVLERRAEIGLRRALGATKRHVATQFLGEALLLAAVGGVGGVALGALVTGFYANFKGWEILIPTLAWAGGLAAAFLIGAVAGLYPAVRAARMSPTEALRTS